MEKQWHQSVWYIADGEREAVTPEGVVAGGEMAPEDVVAGGEMAPEGVVAGGEREAMVPVNMIAVGDGEAGEW